jgi:4-carboxymuconolactone decarboxylase
VVTLSDNADGSGQDTYGRAHWFRPEELSEEQRAVYEGITSGPRASASNRASSLVDEHGRLSGPFNSMLYSPNVGNALQALGAAIRYQTGLGGAAREVCICKVAVVGRCETEWIAHSRLATAAGVSDEQLAVLLRGELPTGLEPEAAMALEVASLLLSTGDLDDSQFARALEALGGQSLMEVIALVGYYDLLALNMRVWRVPSPAGHDPVFTN